jgi:putative hemolysin
MTKHRTKRLAIPWIALTLALFMASTPPAVGVPNPAAAYCLQQGGSFVVRTGPEGDQYGVCVFPDGAECRAWHYYCVCTRDRNTCTPEARECTLPCREQACRQAGETVQVSRCCEGLANVQPTRAFDSQCGDAGLVGATNICTDCGNGLCEEWESPCNCPLDCPGPPGEGRK